MKQTLEEEWANDYESVSCAPRPLADRECRAGSLWQQQTPGVLLLANQRPERVNVDQWEARKLALCCSKVLLAPGQGWLSPNLSH